MFEDFQLEDYGNRIPSLTFEVEADAGAVAIGAIAEALGGGAVAAGATPALAGYAASGDSVRGAIEALADVVPLSLADDDGRLLLTAEGGDPVALGADEEQGRREIVRRGLGQIPAEVSIAYYEPERDYQTGLQRAVRGDGGRGNADRRALPAALSAGAAKALAEYRLATLWTGRATATVRLGWRRAALRPGDQVELAGEGGLVAGDALDAGADEGDARARPRRRRTAARGRGGARPAGQPARSAARADHRSPARSAARRRAGRPGPCCSRPRPGRARAGAARR